MQLHPQAVEFLEQLNQMPGPALHELPVEVAQQGFQTQQHLYGPGPELAEVRDVTTPQGLQLRYYNPIAEPTEQSPKQAILYFHGGGWVLGDLESHDSLCRRLAAASNCPLVAVHYRRAPQNRFPAAFEDCFAATQYVLDRQHEFGCDQVIVSGDSAGGNLAAAVAIAARDGDLAQVIGQILIYPIVRRDYSTDSYLQFADGYSLTRDKMIWFWDCYMGDQQVDARVDLGLVPSLENLPPVHLMLAECDVLFSEGQEYGKRLAEAGVPITTEIYRGMLHGFVHCAGVFDDGLRAARDFGLAARKMLGHNLES